MPVTLKSRFPEIRAELRPHVSAAVKAAAEDVRRAAQANAPVDTGALRDAIHVERRGVGEYAVVAGDGDVFYGHLVEHGSAVGGRGRPPQAPRPFLVPALEANLVAAQLRIEEALRRAV